MTSRRWRSGWAALTGLVLGALLVVPISGQGPYSAQIQALLNGNNTWGGTNTFTTVVVPNALAVGPLAQINTDPIFGTPAPIGLVVGTTLSATGTAYANYTAASVEPSVNGSGIYIGSEILVNEPATNTKAVNLLYGQEAFIYHNSTQHTNTVLGLNVESIWFAGSATGITGILSANENDGVGTIANMTGAYVYGTRNFGSGEVTNGIAIDVQSPQNTGGGTVGTSYGLRIRDQTLAGTSVNRAIDVNGKFIVGPDGSTLSVNGTIQGAFKSNDGTTGVTVSACTGFKNGLCISGT